MPHERHSRRTKEGMLSASDMLRDIKAMNSSILILSQKMKYLVRNEKILGQNLIVLNKKLKALEQRVSGSSTPGEEGFSGGSSDLSIALDELREKVDGQAVQIEKLKKLLNKK